MDYETNVVDDGLKIAPDVTLPIDFVTQTAAILAQRRKGKRLALDTPLPTPTGWTTMGDVQIGDSLFDELGEPCRVTFVSEIAEGDSYRVRFSDGSEIVADAEHLWVTESRPVRRRESAIKTGVLTAAGRAGRPQSQQTAATMPQIRTTAEIAATLRDGKDTNHSIRVVLPLDLPEADLPVDPYVLGFWLGDGTRGYGAATVHDSDAAVLEDIRRLGYEVRERQSQRSGGTGSYTILGIRPRLRELGVLRDKHVPAVYLRASEAQRLALLQGIADADGSCSEQGQVEISVSDPRLARDIYELVVSLGIKATRIWRETNAKPSCRIRFTTTTPVFRLARKARRQPTVETSQTGRRFIVAVEPTASVPMRCIAVDSSSRLFLAGESMIPTHNTYTGSVFAEELVRVRLPWVALDPTGAWWGLRSSADGLHPGLQVVVIGGQHGDLPLDVNAGAAIADLVLDHPGWYVLDLSLLEGRPAEREFATAFGQRLHRRKMQPGMDFPLHLFIDEADLFVPQEKETRADVALLAAYQGIVRRGGLHGLGCTLISQRPALVNKNVLTQLDILILLRLVAGNDQDAVSKNYVSRFLDKERAAEVMDSLATLPVGTAWFLEPGAEPPLAIRRAVRERRTFNSSATPKAGEQRVEPQVFADVDLEAIAAQMAESVERALADDPAELRRRLAAEHQKRVQIESDYHELANWAADVEGADDGPTAIDALVAVYQAAKSRVGASCDLVDEARALARGARKPTISDEQIEAVREIVEALGEHVESLKPTVDAAFAGVRDLLAPLEISFVEVSSPAAAPPAPVLERTEASVDAVERSAPGIVADQARRRREREEAQQRVDAAATNGNLLNLGKGERKVLEALAQYPEGKTQNEVAFLTGYSAKASTIGARLATLRKLGLVEQGQPIRLTPEGFKAAGGARVLPTGQALLDHWLSHPKVGEGERKVLLALIDAYPSTLSNDELAALTGYSATASTIGARLANLRKLGLVEKGARRVTSEFYEAIRG